MQTMNPAVLRRRKRLVGKSWGMVPIVTRLPPVVPSRKPLLRMARLRPLFMDKSGANLAAIQSINAEREAPIEVRQVKHLNNIVEQDHRAIKRMIKPMMGFKNFRCARIILSGIEVMNMIRKGQMKDDGVAQTVAAQFYSRMA